MSITYEKSPEGKLRMLVVDSKIQDITIKELKAEKDRRFRFIPRIRAKKKRQHSDCGTALPLLVCFRISRPGRVYLITLILGLVI